MESWYLRVLGVPELICGEKELTPWRSAEYWSVVVYLALSRVPVPRATLAQTFWPAASDSRTYLRVAIQRLERVLGKGIFIEDEAKTTLALSPSLTCDLVELRKFARKLKRETDTNKRRYFLEEASNLIQGNFLEGFESPWVVTMRETVLKESKDLLGLLLDLQKKGTSEECVATQVLLASLDDQARKSLQGRLIEDRAGEIEKQLTLPGLVASLLKSVGKAHKARFLQLSVFPDVFTKEQATSITSVTQSDLSYFVDVKALRLEVGEYTLTGALRKLLWCKLTGEHQRRLSHKHARYFIRESRALELEIGGLLKEAKRTGGPENELRERQSQYVQKNLAHFKNIFEFSRYSEKIIDIEKLFATVWSSCPHHRHDLIKYLYVIENASVDCDNDYKIEILGLLASAYSKNPDLKFDIDKFFDEFSVSSFGLVTESAISDFYQCLSQLLIVFHNKGNDQRFDSCWEKKREIAQRFPQFALSPHDYHMVAENYMARRRFSEALEHNQRFVEHWKSRDLVDCQGLGLLQQGMILQGLKRCDEARQCWNEAILLLDQSGNLHEKGRCLECLAVLHREAGNLGEALYCIIQAQDLYQQTGDEAAVYASGGTKGDILWDRGKTNEARVLYEQGLVFWRKRQHSRWIERFEARLARFEVVFGKL